jgi:hypothetical protein
MCGISWTGSIVGIDRIGVERIAGESGDPAVRHVNTLGNDIIGH